MLTDSGREEWVQSMKTWGVGGLSSHASHLNIGCSVFSLQKSSQEKLICTLMYMLYFTNTLRQTEQILILYLRVRGTKKEPGVCAKLVLFLLPRRPTSGCVHSICG